MIVLHCINIRKRMKEKKLDIEQLREMIEDYSHEVYSRLNNLYHCSFIPDRNIDMFVYRLAEALECSVDYILGYDNELGMFIPVNVPNKASKEAEYARLISKYGNDNNLNIHNSNTLAYFTSIDRDIFDYLLKGQPSGDTWITSSYYVLAHMANVFGFNYESALNFVFDVNTIPENKQYKTYLLNKYNQEFNS